jgi:acyl dehydratase
MLRASIPTKETAVSTNTQGKFETALIGVDNDPVSFEVERERMIAYAAATNDEIAPHASGEYAPPVFAVVVAFETLAATSVKVAPPELLMRVVHGEQDFRFHQPIVPGARLSTRARVIGITPKSSGVTVTVKADTTDEAGAAVVEQYMTSFFRGAQSEAGASGEPGPGHAFPEEVRGTDPVAVVTQRFDEDQTFRYGPAAGDPMPIHTDDALAKAMGLPGIIIHGLCTMAFTSRAVIEAACPEDPTRLGRLAVRFSKPCLPGQEITTSIWRTDGGAYVYETVNQAGDVVIKDGLAEVATA